MKTFWDVLIDCNNFRIFRTNLSAKESLVLSEQLKSRDWVGERWKTIRAQLAREKSERAKPIADFIAIDLDLPAMSARARVALEDLISEQVEFLPVKTAVGIYYIVHIKYVDCLDQERSQVDYLYPQEKREIYSVSKYAFHWEKLQNVHIFRLPNVIHTSFFVSDEIKQRVEKTQLTGLLFYPVPLVEE